MVSHVLASFPSQEKQAYGIILNGEFPVLFVEQLPRVTVTPPARYN
jgi:hypothetical protein